MAPSPSPPPHDPAFRARQRARVLYLGRTLTGWVLIVAVVVILIAVVIAGRSALSTKRLPSPSQSPSQSPLHSPAHTHHAH